MSSDNSPSDVDSKKIIALVGTDKLDGSELDNVRTGLTPPNKTEFLEQHYSVEDIATPMRFDEEENLQIELELHDIGFTSTQTQFMKFGDETLLSNLGKEIRIL